MTSPFDELVRYDDARALIDDEGRAYSYRELTELAGAMTDQIPARALIFILCRNCPEAIAAYVGALQKRIVPTLLDDATDFSSLSDLIDLYRPAFVWAPQETKTPKTFTAVQTQGNYRLYATGFPQTTELYDELALLLTTSGSTGSPKLVRQSYKNLTSNTASIVAYLEIRSDDRAITTLPMQYTYGLSIINTHLNRGACLILTNASILEKRFWTLCREQQATTFGGVPYTYEMLKRLHFDRMELPSLRYLTQAGGKLSAEMVKEFCTVCEAKNIRFIVMYGQTEATARMSYLPFSHAKEKNGSIGIAIPNGRFELADDGELIYFGDNVTLGYAEQKDDLAKGDENGGVLRTGDIATVDADGFYYIVGRKKRFLKMFGNRVNLDELEGALKRLGIENACAGEDDCLKIYITKKEQENATKTYIRDHTGVSSNGVKIVVIDEIPRNAAGKALYGALPS